MKSETVFNLLRKVDNYMNKFVLIERLCEESQELSEKIFNLESFMKSEESEELSPTQMELLNDQYDAMRDYLTILLRRIVDLNEGGDDK